MVIENEQTDKKDRVRRKTRKTVNGDNPKPVLQFPNNEATSTVGTPKTQIRDNNSDAEPQRRTDNPVSQPLTLGEALKQFDKVLTDHDNALKIIMQRVEDQDKVLEKVYRENEELKASKAIPQKGGNMEWLKMAVEQGFKIVGSVIEKGVTQPAESSALKELEPLYKESLKSQLQSNIDMNKLAVDKARLEVTKLSNPGGWRKVMDQ